MVSFSGESPSEVGLRAGLRRDLWTAVEPDTSRIDRLAAEADRKFPDASPRLSLFIAGTLAAGYAKNPPPATFRVIDSPLVTWIWLGGLIVVAGTASPPFMVEAAHRIVKELPAAELAELPDQDHAASPELLAPVISEFLRR